MLKITLLVLTVVCFTRAAYSNWYYWPTGRSAATGTTTYAQPIATQTIGNSGYYVVTQQHPAYTYPRQQLTTANTIPVNTHTPLTATQNTYPTYYQNVHPNLYYPGWSYAVSSF